MNFSLVIPTLNAEIEFKKLLPSLEMQSVQPSQFLVLDSESNDQTVAVAKQFGAKTVTIKRSDFNHGGTRNIGAELSVDYPIVVYMTQDAVLASRDSLKSLLSHFERQNVDAVYGRQLPRDGALHIEAFARLFNYPDKSEERSFEDRHRLGFKTIFFSNSFSAYRTDRLLLIGGFRSDLIFGEDSLAIASFLGTGGKIVYDREAVVRHSHCYSMGEEMRRYFDIGVMHSRHRSLLETFSGINTAGRAFVREELRFLGSNAPAKIPEALLRTLSKYLGYRLGRIERHLPLAVKRSLSMNRRYWE